MARWIQNNVWTYKVKDTDIELYIAEAMCSECKLYSTQSSGYDFVSYDFCPRCGVKMCEVEE